MELTFEYEHIGDNDLLVAFCVEERGFLIVGRSESELIDEAIRCWPGFHLEQGKTPPALTSVSFKEVEHDSREIETSTN